MAFGVSAAFADGWDPNSQASNTGSISNTRHNLTVTFLPSDYMWRYRNNYGEVCVYCHTPHGANRQIAAPLWNRTKKSNTYTLYNIPLMSGQTPTQPGVSSLTCLSCHDGTTAIDSVINMPGSGKYNAAQETTQSNAFLNTWTSASEFHYYLKPFGSSYTCAEAGCHDTTPTSVFIPGIGWIQVWDVPSFDPFVIGTDLRNDHPIGVQLPDTNIYDFKAPNTTTASLKIFDSNTNGRADANEVRFYDTGEGFEVECASCHDPHGVPSAGAGSLLIPSFLRVSNAGSALCLTCHDK